MMSGSVPNKSRKSIYSPGTLISNDICKCQSGEPEDIRLLVMAISRDVTVESRVREMSYHASVRDAGRY